SRQQLKPFDRFVRYTLSDQLVNVAIVPGKALRHWLVHWTIELRVQDCCLLPKRPFQRQNFHGATRLSKTLRKLLRYIRRHRLRLARPVVRPRAHFNFHCPSKEAGRFRRETGWIIEQQGLLVRVILVRTERPLLVATNLRPDSRFK